jgi:hypothetical protein
MHKTLNIMQLNFVQLNKKKNILNKFKVYKY